MTRILTVLLLLLSAVAFAIGYVNTDNAQRSVMQHAATALGRSFTIPSDPRLDDPAQTYPALLSAAREARVNIFRTSAGYSSEDRPQVTQYALLTGDTRLFEAFNLQRGRWLTPSDTQSSSAFLSTVATKERDEVGVLRDFGGDDVVYIRGLRDAFNSLPVAGSYIIEPSTTTSFEQFLVLFTQRATREGGSAGRPLSVASFKASHEDFAGIDTRNAAILKAVQYLVILLTALLLVYRLLHEAKRAGVMKLHGFGTLRVWYDLSGRLIIRVLLVSVALSLLVIPFIHDTTPQFVTSVLMSLARAFAVMLASSLLTAAYIARIRVSDSVKNRKDTKWVFASNTVIRAICSILLIIVGAGLWLQYSNVAAARAELGNWEKTKDYGIFYPTSVGNDLIEAQTGQAGPTTAEVYDLYPILDKAGALFVDSSSYEPTALTQSDPSGSFRSMQVNPNYLHAYPLRDTSGHTIDVPESTSEWVVLAPEKLRTREREIRAGFERMRASAYEGEKAVFSREPPARLAHQRVSIVWMTNKQRVFSFNPLVNPSAGNEITEPVIQVMTLGNSLGVDRANGFSGSADSALKPRLVDGGAAATLKVLAPTLKGLKLDDNLRYLVTMDEYVLQQLQALQVGVRNVAIAAIALATGMLALVIQSLAISFERYSRKIVVRRLLGFGFGRAYREFLLLFTVIWGFQVVGALLANRIGVSPLSTPTSSSVASDSVVLGISGFIISVELAFSIVALGFIERRSLTRVLKGEF